MMQHPRRSSQDWLELINSCRTSGMTITAWCQANTIPKGSYESAVKRLVRQGLLASSGKNDPSPGQRVICVSDMERSKKYPAPLDGRTAVILEAYGARLEILDGAAPETLRNTLAALRELC